MELFLSILSCWLMSHCRRAVIWVTLESLEGTAWFPPSRNCLLWHLFWLCPLLCLLCSKDLCVPISPTSMHGILWNQNGLQILGDIRHAVHHCLSFFGIVMMKRTTWNGQNKAKETQRQTSWKAKISCLVGYKNKTVPRITARHSRLSRAG